MLSFLAKLYIWAIRAPRMREHGHKPFKTVKSLCFFSMFFALYAVLMIHCTSIVQAKCELYSFFVLLEVKFQPDSVELLADFYNSFGCKYCFVDVQTSQWSNCEGSKTHPEN